MAQLGAGIETEEQGAVRMAKVVLTGIEEAIANSLKRALAVERHQVHQRPSNAPIYDFLGADIVFAGGAAERYLPLLQGVRQARPALPFIVVTKFPNPAEWLDALEAGATDYWSAPFELRQVNRLMESVVSGTPGA
jgi:DNA-binding NtrC family response regulator